MTELVAESFGYQKYRRRFYGALLALLCLSLQATAQSRLPAPAHRDNRQTFNAQPNPIKYVVPKHLTLGKSVKGYDIMASVYGSGAKHVLVFGGIHGDEPHTTVLARALAVNINQSTLPSNLTLVIVPDVNPDGLMASTRVNANGVDINRNFPSRTWRADYTEPRWNPGAQASSEPETRAVLSLLERYPPHLVVTLHAAMGCVNWDGTSGGPFAQVMATINGYPLCSSLGYETPGSLGMLTGIDRQVPTVTIELRPTNASAAVQENLNALLTLLKHFAAQ